MKRIFVTGIAGFIGFHLALALKRLGYVVTGCDNFNPYYDPELKRKRATVLKAGGIEVLQLDIGDGRCLRDAILAHKTTHLVHLAAQAGVRYSLKHPQIYQQSNLDGFFNVLEVLRHHPDIALIFASSSSVYGLNTKVPFAETDPTENQASFYGATKKCNEIMAHAYQHLYGFSCIGLRFFTVYGPYGRPDMAYFSFTRAILEDKPIALYGEGALLRDYTYVDDIIAGTVAAIDLGAGYEIFNLGNNQPASVLDMLKILEELLGKKALIEYHPTPEGDVPVTYADIHKSARMLGFQPKTALREGLTRFVKWYQADPLTAPPSILL